MNSSSQCQNVQRNLIVCLHFNTQGTEIDMVGIFHGLHRCLHKIAWSQEIP